MDRSECLAFADVLLPGDDLFPPAGATGIAALLDRLPSGFFAALGALSSLDAAARIAHVAQFQAAHPKLFADAQKAIYLAYYEQPEVVAAIRAMGIAYHSVLLPEGYDLPPFDLARDTPRHGRGAWTPTGQVRPLDIAHLKG